MYTFNIRHLYRLMHGMSSVRADKMQNEFEVAKLWSSEAYRTLVDRVDDRDERKMFNMIIQQLAQRTFTFAGETQRLPSKLGRPFYSHLCPADGRNGAARGALPDYASEVGKIKHLKPLLEQLLHDYNHSSKGQPASISLFDFMIENIVKVTRAIRLPYSNVILVGAPGLGKMAISRLSIFVCKFERTELSIVEEFQEDEWQRSLARMISSASLGTKPHVLNIEENQMSEEVILIDLNCLLKNGELPDLLAREEVAGFLGAVKATLSRAAVDTMTESQIFQEYLSRV